MTPRIARDRRRAGVRTVLGDRDRALLRALARFRLATTDDLTRLLFQGVRRDTALDRLRRLFDGGYVAVRFGDRNAQNLYSLGPQGLRWAEGEGIAAKCPPQGDCSHHLAIVRAWVALASVLRSHPVLALARFRPDWELRTSLAGTGALVVPDAAIEIAFRQGPGRDPVQAVLEVDLTTERAAALERKFAAYDLQAYGLLPIVVLSDAGARRQAAIRALLARTGVREGLVGSEAEWPGLLLERLVSAPLAATPCLEGRANPGSGSDSMGSVEQGEVPSR